VKTILEAITLGEEFLRKKGISRARREAEELIAEALSLKRLDLYLDFERPLEENDLEKCRTFFSRRAKREPLQYIAGRVSFAGVSLKVTPAVLIPRPETEILVEKICTELSSYSSLENKVLIDMCTGSGCIGIALKKRFPTLNVILTDISADALKIAAENAQENGVDVTLVQGDLFSPLEGKSCDFFVANPPYVFEEEYQSLAPEVRDFEPKGALVGGVEFYRRIADKLYPFLHEEGRGWLEIGYQQKEAVMALFKKFPWQTCAVDKDWADKDRFLVLKR
jgi:release factor glutamine methyltransferase